MNFTIAGIALAVAAALGGYGGYKATRLHYEHVIDQAEKKSAAAVAAADQRAENAASDWEVWASIQRPKAVTITREVEREVKADPDCSQRALPDRLRDALTAAGSAANQPVADRAVPAPFAAGAFDLGRPRDGLFRSLGGAFGMQGAASGAR